VSLIPLATVGAYKRLPSDIYLLSSMFIWTIVSSVRLSFNEIKVEFIYLNSESMIVCYSLSTEGTPYSVDSVGVVRQLSGSFASTWSPVCDLRTHVSTGFIVGYLIIINSCYFSQHHNLLIKIQLFYYTEGLEISMKYSKVKA